MADDVIGYILTQYPGRGMAPERSDFEDKVKAEKAFTDAKMASILWQSRPVSSGLGWIKMKEKEAPPPATPAPVKPAVPAAAGAVKPAVPAPAAAAAKPAVPPAAAVPPPAGATPAVAPKPTGAANPVVSAPPPAAAAPTPAADAMAPEKKPDAAH